MEIWAECAKNRILSISRLLLSDTEKIMEFVKTSDLVKIRSRYSLDSAGSTYIPALGF